MTDAQAKAVFQMPPDRLTDAALEWPNERGVLVPELPGVVLFRMPSDRAGGFIVVFPGLAVRRMSRR